MRALIWRDAAPGDPHTFRATPGELGDLVSYDYRLNDGAATTVAASADGSATFTVTPALPGRNTVSVIGHTAAGLPTGEASLAVYVDYPPTTPSVTSPDLHRCRARSLRTSRSSSARSCSSCSPRRRRTGTRPRGGSRSISRARPRSFPSAVTCPSFRSRRRPSRRSVPRPKRAGAAIFRRYGRDRTRAAVANFLPPKSPESSLLRSSDEHHTLRLLRPGGFSFVLRGLARKVTRSRRRLRAGRSKAGVVTEISGASSVGPCSAAV